MTTATDITIGLDVFPAEVVLPSGGSIRKVRAIVADGELLVYVNDNGTPREYYRGKVKEASGGRMRGYQLQLEGGEARVYTDPWCGCGSPLKRYNPWPGLRKIQSPL